MPKDVIAYEPPTIVEVTPIAQPLIGISGICEIVSGVETCRSL